MKSLLRLFLKVAAWIVSLGLALLLVNAFLARKQPGLMPWHTASLDREFRAGDLPPDATLEAYLEIEKQVFREMASKLEGAIDHGEGHATSRYAPGGANNPATFSVDWNRTFELVPEGTVRGSALMLHGLTDSPYSFRALAEVLHEEGFYVLGLRLPGHGTIPAALKKTKRQDWEAAVEIAARHAGPRRGKGKFVIFGYSNGGALAVKYALHALETKELPPPDQLVLLSPAIGITPAAVLARAHEALSWMPYFAQSAWSSIQPEIDPYKYTSFPMSVGYQTHTLTRSLQREVVEAEKAGRIGRLCPILTFKSLADATVSVEEAVARLYNHLDGEGHELVIFDVNQAARMKPFFRQYPGTRLAYLRDRTDLPYRLTLVSNEGASGAELNEHTRPAREALVTTRTLDLRWPPGFYSLSHVALNFPPDDPVYGYLPPPDPYPGVPLGRLEPRGERALLVMSADFFSRLRSNPFFDYLEDNVLAATQ